MEHITANLAVDAATPENGCLEVVPGSHKMQVDCSKGFITLEWQKAHEWVQVPLEPGDMLIFGSHLAHRSAPNNTNAARASIYATYANKSEGVDLRQKYYEHRRIAFPPDHGKCHYSCAGYDANDSI
jgi:2-aminoethylphosphonate dioxygenase